jgi:serine/threonine protein kinase
MPYEFIQSINEGSFGRVYLARDSRSGGLVAIKELKQVDPPSLQRFEREIRLLIDQVNNRFVVDVLDFNLLASPPFVVMEYCDAGSLRSWVGQGLPWEVIAGAIGHVAEALAGIHKAGGFHRDLKPDNLLLSRVGDQGIIVKVADFGLARMPHATGTMTYSAAGTRGYIAPEIMMGADFHSGADIYSLGVVALELLTGGLDPSGLVASNAPEQFKSLMRAMLSPLPYQRPNIQRVAQILNDLLKPPCRGTSVRERKKFGQLLGDVVWAGPWPWLTLPPNRCLLRRALTGRFAPSGSRIRCASASPWSSRSRRCRCSTRTGSRRWRRTWASSSSSVSTMLAF